MSVADSIKALLAQHLDESGDALTFYLL